MRIFAILKIAVRALKKNVMRTSLTMLGIIIGVAAVVALMAIGKGSTATITANITANGANLLTVRSGAANTGVPATAGAPTGNGGAQVFPAADAPPPATPPAT